MKLFCPSSPFFHIYCFVCYNNDFFKKTGTPIIIRKELIQLNNFINYLYVLYRPYVSKGILWNDFYIMYTYQGKLYI